MKKEKKVPELQVDCVVVGGGPAGMAALGAVKKQLGDDAKVVLLEAAPSFGGRSKSALHLLDVDASQSFAIVTSNFLDPLKVRWEREWVDFDQVNWQAKDWVAVLPQWTPLSVSLKTVLMDVNLSVDESWENLETKLQSPVNFLAPSKPLEGSEDGAETHWELRSPDAIYFTPKVVWAAGLKPFQNAFGKQEAQEYLVANPRYQMDAADFRGGIAFDLEFAKGVQPIWTEGFPENALFGVPTRFEGKFYLMLGALVRDENRVTLRTLTHVHQDLLSDPKLVASFQKALRRSIKTLFELPEGAEIPMEQWVVSDRILGHSMGSNWLLKGVSGASGLSFVGDEVSGPQTCDTLAALESATQ